MAYDPILDAACAVFARYGVRKTTMADIASEAQVSRQTLYGRFENKDGILRAVIHHVSDQVLTRCAAEWSEVDTLAEQLWIYFDHAIIDIYRMVQTAPDAEDIVSGKGNVAMAAFLESQAAHVEALTPLFAPYSAMLAKKGQSPAQLVHVLLASASAQKHAAIDEDGLRKGLRTLQMMVLAMVGET